MFTQMIALITMFNTNNMQVNEGCGVVAVKHNNTVTVVYKDRVEQRVDNRLDVGDEYCPASAPVHVCTND